MKHTLQIALVAVVLLVSVNLYAAKGDAKAKKGVVLKFSGFELKGFNSLNMFAKNSFMLKGNFTTPEKAPQNGAVNSFITIQRGNTTFIYPYKHKVSMPMFKTPSAPKL